MNALSHPYKAVVFDMDGTLLDTESIFRTIVFEVSGALGFEMTDLLHRKMVGSSHETTEKLLAEAYGVSFPYALFDQRCRIHMRERLNDVPVKPGARALLKALKESDVPIAVATSSRAPHVKSHLGAAGLIDLFDAIVTREDVQNPKPHPEPYLTAARRLKVRPQACIAFEDSHSGVRAAHAAGMRTVMVPDLIGPTDEIASLCVAVLESLAHAHPHLVGSGPVNATASAKHSQVKTRG